MSIEPHDDRDDRGAEVQPRPEALLRCRCGSTEVRLVLTTVEHHSWDGALRVMDDEIRVADSAHLRRCDVTVEKTRLHCGSCGHHWHPRRPIGTAPGCSPGPAHTTGIGGTP